MWGSIVGGIGSVVGGVLGLQSQKQSAANAEKLNQLNYEHQKEFAQNGIRWKVADAKAAGLHPLAALGASTAQYTPATAIGDSPDWSFLADAGQSIGRAVDAKRTQQERVEQQQKQDAAFALKAENQKAENDLIRAQTASIQQDMVLRQAKASEQAVRTQQQVPAMPSLGRDGSVIAGQGDATSPAGIEAKPAEIVVIGLFLQGCSGMISRILSLVVLLIRMSRSFRQLRLRLVALLLALSLTILGCLLKLAE
jgi:hypothetical protein